MNAISEISPEMVIKLQALLPHTPFELVVAIKDYWGATKERSDRAVELINQHSLQKPQSDN